MNQTSTCIFCQINANKLPSYEIARSNHCRVVLDTHPITRGHMIAISNSHESHLHLLQDAEFYDLLNTVKQITAQLSQALPDVSACNVIVNNGRQAGQHIQHVHVHIVPRRRFDTLTFYWRIFTRFINPFSQLNQEKSLKKMHGIIGKQLALND